VDEAAFMAKDFRQNRRGCFIVGAIVAALIAALAWGIVHTRDDPRSNGVLASPAPPATGAAPAAPAEAETGNPK
jgi:hypothetical protein